MVNRAENKKEVVLVTGGSGLIGRNLINRLADKYQMIGLDKVGNPFPHPESENITFDLTKEDSIKKALERVRHAYGSRIASVIHLAAYYDFSGEPSPLYNEITIKGTEKLLNVLKGYEVEQFVFSSTNLVYKPCEPGQKIDEDWPLDPNWEYPKSKVKTEAIIREKYNDIPYVILRIAGVYDNKCHSIPLSHQIQRIYEEELIGHLYSGNISHGNAFVHLDDLLYAMEKTIEKRKELPGDAVLNISEPVTFSYGELQEEIGRLLHGEKWKTYRVPKAVAKAGAGVMDQFGDSFIKPWMIDRTDDHYEHDVSRAEKLLGWKPKHNLKETLPKMIEALREDPITWYKENKIEPPSELKEKKE